MRFAGSWGGPNTICQPGLLRLHAMETSNSARSTPSVLTVVVTVMGARASGWTSAGIHGAGRPYATPGDAVTADTGPPPACAQRRVRTH
ncbi:MAG: hypothetical protein AMXMBFR8_24250 [Nevskiales bacterium]